MGKPKDQPAPGFMLDTGKEGLDPRGARRQNPDAYFWKAEVFNEAADRFLPNPVRGFVLAIFRRPEEMDDETGEMKRAKLACWMLLSAPTMAVGRDKKAVQRPAGTIVWVDINQSIAALARRAAPAARGERDGLPTAVYEVLIVPQHKRPIPSAPNSSKPRQAWIMHLYGGRSAPASDGFRKLETEQLAALAEHVQIPDFGPANIESFPLIGAPPEEITALPESTEPKPAEGAATAQATN